MAVFVEIALLLSLVANTYRSGRRFFNTSSEPNPVLARVFSNHDGLLISEDDEAAQACEVELTRQLLNGRLDPTAYQLSMTELAETGVTESHDAR